MGVCNCPMFCCTLLSVHSSFAIILMGKRELVALLNLSSWCLVMVVRLFLAVPWGCLRFVIVVFPDHTHVLIFMPVYVFVCVIIYLPHLIINLSDKHRRFIQVMEPCKKKISTKAVEQV